MAFEFGPGGTFGNVGSTIGSAIGGLIGGSSTQSPFDAAKPYMNEAGGDINKYLHDAVHGFNPYLSAGSGALGNYMNMLGQEANPQAFYNKVMGGFHMSPAQQFAQKQGLEAVSNQGAASGMMGSGNEAKALEQYAQNNTAQAQQQYLNNIMGMYRNALGGYGNVAGMGEQAAGQTGGYYMRAGEDQAQIRQEEAAAAAAAAKSKGGGLGAIGSAIGGLL